MTPRRRLLWFAAGLTLGVGLLIGLVSSLVNRSLYWISTTYLDPAASGPAARFGAEYVEVVGIFGVLALYVGLPFAVAYVSSGGDDRGLMFHFAWAVAAVAFLPVLVASVAASRIGNPYIPLGRRLVGVVVPVVFAAGLFVAHRLALSRSPDGVDRTPPPAVFANIGVVLLLLGGMTVGAALAAPAGTLVETYDVGPPATNFEFSTERTDDGMLLVATHAGGDPVAADRLHVTGSGFADVPAADQTEPGVWRGDASGDAPRGDGRAVVEGDSVALGVTDDCEVRLTYHYGGSRTTVAKHDCGADDEG